MNKNDSDVQKSIKRSWGKSKTYDKNGNELNLISSIFQKISDFWFNYNLPIMIIFFVLVIFVLFFSIRNIASSYYRMPLLKSKDFFETYSFAPQNIRPFYISKKPVLASEFEKFVNSSGYVPSVRKSGNAVLHNEDGSKMNLSKLSKSSFLNSSYTAVLVSYIDAANFCNWKSGQDGFSPVYKISQDKIEINPSADGYRLPTSEEWEYAATKHKKLLNSGISEWCSSVYESKEKTENNAYKIIKGCNVFTSDLEKKASYSSYSNQFYPVDSIGFRILRNSN